MSETIQAFRICKTRYVGTAFDGEGAFRFGGRWNSRGTKMIYTAGSLSLAVLEMLVHLDDDSMLLEYSYIPAQIPTDLIINVVDFQSLPKNWSDSPTTLQTQHIGDKWITDKLSAVLKVPTSVIPLERNYLFNPAHKDFENISLGSAESFMFDKRLKK